MVALGVDAHQGDRFQRIAAACESRPGNHGRHGFDIGLAVKKIEQLRDTDRDIDNAVRVLMRELEG